MCNITPHTPIPPLPNSFTRLLSFRCQRNFHKGCAPQPVGNARRRPSGEYVWQCADCLSVVRWQRRQRGLLAVAAGGRGGRSSNAAAEPTFRLKEWIPPAVMLQVGVE